jgi:ketosteroid isomerase-like protein
VSEENVQHARRSYAILSDALRASDLRAIARLIEERFDPEVVLKPAGVLPESEEMYGHDGALRWLTTQMEAFETMWLETQEFIDAGDSVVVTLRAGGHARHTGIDLEFERIHVPTYRRGKVVRLEMYASKQQAFEAVGLRK